jgi:hypothetical protein
VQQHDGGAIRRRHVPGGEGDVVIGEQRHVLVDEADLRGCGVDLRSRHIGRGDGGTDDHRRNSSHHDDQHARPEPARPPPIPVGPRRPRHDERQAGGGQHQCCRTLRNDVALDEMGSEAERDRERGDAGERSESRPPSRRRQHQHRDDDGRDQRDGDEADHPPCG